MSTHRLTAGRYTGPMTNAGAARAIAHYLRTVHGTNPATLSAASTLDEMAFRIEADESRHNATRRELDAVAIEAADEVRTAVTPGALASLPGWLTTNADHDHDA